MALLIVYSTLVGFVAAGLTGSLWALFAGRQPSLDLIVRPHALLPLAVLAVTFHGPLMLLRYASVLPLRRWWALAASALWCFLEGVFILTRLFAVT